MYRITLLGSREKNLQYVCTLYIHDSLHPCLIRLKEHSIHLHQLLGRRP